MDDQTLASSRVSEEVAPRGLYQPPMELAVLKQLDRLDPHFSSLSRPLPSSARPAPAAAPM